MMIILQCHHSSDTQKLFAVQGGGTHITGNI